MISCSKIEFLFFSFLVLDLRRKKKVQWNKFSFDDGDNDNAHIIFLWRKKRLFTNIGRGELIVNEEFNNANNITTQMNCMLRDLFIFIFTLQLWFVWPLLLSYWNVARMKCFRIVICRLIFVCRRVCCRLLRIKYFDWNLLWMQYGVFRDK
jgi:hypothetical protein